MFCKACNNFFRIDRHFNELFKSFKNCYFCPKCAKKITINYSLIVMPLANKRMLYNVNIFRSLPTNDYNYFYKYYLKIFNFFRKIKGVLVLEVDEFSEENLANYECISELFEQDIVVVSFLLKTF